MAHLLDWSSCVPTGRSEALSDEGRGGRWIAAWPPGTTWGPLVRWPPGPPSKHSLREKRKRRIRLENFLLRRYYGGPSWHKKGRRGESEARRPLASPCVLGHEAAEVTPGRKRGKGKRENRSSPSGPSGPSERTRSGREERH